MPLFKKEAILAVANKNMVCLVTAADGNPVSGTAIAATPFMDSYVRVLINGVAVSVGNGVKTSACYFSGDAGVTARAIAAIAAGDTCHWVGSVAGYNLAITDVADFDYLV